VLSFPVLNLAGCFSLVCLVYLVCAPCAFNKFALLVNFFFRNLELWSLSISHFEKNHVVSLTHLLPK